MGQTQTHNAIACFVPSSNNGIKGTVKFYQNGKCEIKLQGLVPNHTHAIHIHEFGDLTGGCKTCGGHYNPENVTHGSLKHPIHPRHVGDLCNNITANNKGVVIETHHFPDVIVNDILGRSVVIHKLADDLGMQGIYEGKKFKSYLTTNSLDFVDYKIIMSKLNSLSNPKEIINIKRDIFNSIAKIPDRLIRAQYCKIYYKKLDVSEEIMLKEVSQARRKNKIDDSKDEIKSTKKETKDSIERNNYSITKEDKRLNTLEKELIRLLLNYGNQEFTIKNERTTVAAMIINDLTADKIKFSSPELNILYERVKKEIKEKGEIDTYYFINTNLDISDMAIDLISTQHSISENWEEKHNIFTIRENERMQKTTEKAILSLKKAHVDLQISLLQKQINTPNFTTSDIQKLSALTKIKNEIAKSLGRNVG